MTPACAQLSLPWTLKEWDGPMQFEDPSGKLMMLPSDLVLIQDVTAARARIHSLALIATYDAYSPPPGLASAASRRVLVHERIRGYPSPRA